MAKKKETTPKIHNGIQKEPVHLREKILANGNRSLYLDIYREGSRKKEYLKLYLVPEKNRMDKERNAQTLATAQAIKAKRQIELQNGEYSFTRQYAEDTPFLAYFRKLCDQRIKPGTRATSDIWHSCLRYLEHYCDESTTFKRIDRDWILGFKDYLDHVEKGTHKIPDNPGRIPDNGLSQGSKFTYFNKFMSSIHTAYEERIIADNPLRGVDGFKEPEVERNFLTVEELKQMIKTPCKNKVLKAAFVFSCLTGLRKSDIMKLTWGEIHKFGDYYRIVFNQKKTGGLEYMDINYQAFVLLGKRGENDEHVFKGFKYSSWTLLELRRWVMDAGIRKDITFHCARHTFAVMMITRGADLYTVSKLLGHKNIQSTEIYAKIVDRKKQQAINLIPQLID